MINKCYSEFYIPQRLTSVEIADSSILLQAICL